VFNIQGASWSRALNQFATHTKNVAPTTADVCPRDVEGIAARSASGASFVVRSFRRGHVRVLGLKEYTSIMLAHKEWDIFTVAEVLRCGDVEFAAIGLSAMYNGGGAVLRVDGGQNTASVSAYGLGEFVCYASSEPSSVVVDGRSVPTRFDARTRELAVELGATEAAHELRFQW